MLHFLRNQVLMGVEGIDNAGTTTQSLIMANCLSLMGFRVLLTYDPYDEKENRAGWIVRRLITGDIPGFSVKELGITQEELRQFYARATLWLTENHIIPFFRGDKVPRIVDLKASWNGHSIALSDRWIDSGFAYGIAKGLRKEVIEEAFRECYSASAIGYIDVSAEVAAVRHELKGATSDYYESDIAFQERARQNYLERSLSPTSDFKVIDGVGTKKEVAWRLLTQFVLPHIKDRLGYEYHDDLESLLDTALLEL